MKIKEASALIFLTMLISIINLNQVSSTSVPEITIKNNTIELNSLSLEQKIAQMFIIKGDKKNLDLPNFDIGGIIIGELNTKEEYKKLISEYQNKTKIKLFISADLEGYWNPFYKFASFPNVDEIETKEEAYLIGKKHGELLTELGFNLNFAPVAEIEDLVWKHRAFSGNTTIISKKINHYIQGLQETGVLATAKHYPGGSLNIKDPHKYNIKANISQEQLNLFDSLENVSAIMIGHPIVEGAINSEEKPSSVSPKVISRLKENFTGLIISDDINMKGLQNNYLFGKRQLFIDLINAGNDIIIDGYSHFFPKYDLNKKINYIEKAVKTGKIKEETIDASVKKILIAKGYRVN